jgi:hypothetical protein
LLYGHSLCAMKIAIVLQGKWTAIMDSDQQIIRPKKTPPLPSYRHTNKQTNKQTNKKH